MKKLKVGKKVVMPSGRIAEITGIKGHEVDLVYEGTKDQVCMTYMNLYRAYVEQQRVA